MTDKPRQSHILEAAKFRLAKCPTCDSWASDPCRYPSGGTRKPHVSRWLPTLMVTANAEVVITSDSIEATAPDGHRFRKSGLQWVDTYFGDAAPHRDLDSAAESLVRNHELKTEPIED